MHKMKKKYIPIQTPVLQFKVNGVLCYFKNHLKPRSHIACDCDAIALRPKKLTIAERSQRSRKGFISSPEPKAHKVSL